jgi:hypothetical protein
MTAFVKELPLLALLALLGATGACSGAVTPDVAQGGGTEQSASTIEPLDAGASQDAGGPCKHEKRDGDANHHGKDGHHGGPPGHDGANDHDGDRDDGHGWDRDGGAGRHGHHGGHGHHDGHERRGGCPDDDDHGRPGAPPPGAPPR